MTIVLLLGAGVARAQTPAATPPDELLRQADAALQKEDYASAAQALEAYLAQNPQDYRAKFNLALAYSLTGRKPEAIALYRQVLAQQSDLVPAHLNLGILLLEAGRAAEALEQFQLVVEKQPDHWAAQFNRANALVALGRVPEASEAYERAIELKPDFAPTHLAYAEVLAPADPAAAERHLRRALELDPALEAAKLALAGVLEVRASQQSDADKATVLEEAAAIYQQLLAAHPERVELRIRLGELYLDEKRLTDAIRELEAARAAGSTTVLVNDALLHAYLEVKQNDKALALLPELLAQDGSNAELYLLQGSLLMEKRQYQQAVGSFRRSIELAPESAGGYTNLASALYLIQDYPGTVGALEKVTALGKDTAGSYFLRAITLDKLGAKQPALENYQRFLAADGKKNPDQEFQARQRSLILAKELKQSRGR